MLKGRDLSDKKLQLDALDGLRGLAVLLVFLSHTSNAKIYLFPHADFSGVGKSGVFLFFVLSSFLLTLPFIKKGSAAINRTFLVNYGLRRFFRIYPLYFLYLLLALITTMTLWKIIGYKTPIGLPFTLSFQQFLAQLLLMQGKGVTWSILVEFRYYFILPILALTYSAVLRNRLLPSVLLTIVLIILTQLIWPQAESGDDEARLGPYLPVFFMGSLLAVIYHNWQQSNLLHNKKTMLLVEVMGLLALCILIYMTPSVSSYFLQQEIPYDYYHKQFITFSILWAMVVFASVAGLGLLKKIFEISFLRYLGFISFSVYLFHIVVYGVLSKMTNNLPLFGWIMLGITIVISHISWLLIEKPTSRIRFDKQPKTPQS